MASTKNNSVYLVTYRDPKDGGIQELKVRSIDDSSLGLSFISLAGFIFDTSSVIVNPEEENKRIKYENVKSLHLSIYSIISIAEIGAETPKLAFKNDKAKLLVLQNNDPSPDVNN